MIAFIIPMLIYFVALMVISAISSRNAGESSFYHGDHESPWYVVAIGMIGATLSGVTFISVPGQVGTDAFHYLQFVMGNFVGYLIIANWLLPFYYKKNIISIYSLLESGAGKQGKLVASGLFIVSKLIGAAFRLYIVVMVLQMAVFDQLGVPFPVTVLICLLIIWLYTFKSGIKTVVWSDLLQTVVLITAVVVTIVTIFERMGLGFSNSVDVLWNMSQTTIFNWDWQSANFFPKQFLAGIFVTLAINGFDQDIMQKNLTCKNSKQARKNMIWFSVGFVISVFLFLVLGALLYSFAGSLGIGLPEQTDKVFPVIALNNLGPVVAVLFVLGVTAAAFSSADSATTALSTTFCVDFIGLKDRSIQFCKRARFLTHIGFSVLLFCIIVAFNEFNNRSVVNAIFMAAGYTYGPILGIFIFVMFIKRRPMRMSILPICIVSPLLTWLLTWITSFDFGYGIIIVNTSITVLLMLAFSEKKEDDPGKNFRNYITDTSNI